MSWVRPETRPIWYRTVMMGRRPPTIIDIQEAVCRRFCVEQQELLSECRERRLAHPRQVAMYLSKTLTGQSVPQIGRRFRRDHSTVEFAVRKVNARRIEDPALDSRIRALIAQLSPPQCDEPFAATPIPLLPGLGA